MRWAPPTSTSLPFTSSVFHRRWNMATMNATMSATSCMLLGRHCDVWKGMKKLGQVALWLTSPPSLSLRLQPCAQSDIGDACGDQEIIPTLWCPVLLAVRPNIKCCLGNSKILKPHDGLKPTLKILDLSRAKRFLCMFLLRLQLPRGRIARVAPFCIAVLPLVRQVHVVHQDWAKRSEQKKM